MKEIYTLLAPHPAGHYSQGVVHGETLYVSGQLSIDPITRQPIHGTIEAQLTQALQNILAIAEAAGSNKNNVLKCTIFISDMDFWPRVNEAYAAFFGTHKPSRSIVPVNTLHHNLLVEVEAVVAVKN